MTSTLNTPTKKVYNKLQQSIKTMGVSLGYDNWCYLKEYSDFIGESISKIIIDSLNMDHIKAEVERYRNERQGK